MNRKFSDRDRLVFFMNHGPKSFDGVSTDLDELALKVARNEHVSHDPYADDADEGSEVKRPIRDEPNEDDRIEAFRIIVDKAIVFQLKRPCIDIIDRKRTEDRATFERLCMICIGEIPTDIGKLSMSDLRMIAELIRRDCVRRNHR